MSSNVTTRRPGSLTSGDSEQLLLVGPRQPATKRGLSELSSSATSRAIRAAASLRAQAWDSVW